MTKIIALVISVVLHVVVIASLALPDSSNDDLQSVMIKLKPAEQVEKIEKESSNPKPKEKEQIKQESKVQSPEQKPVRDVIADNQFQPKDEDISPEQSMGFQLDSAVDESPEDGISDISNIEPTQSPADIVDTDSVKAAYQKSILQKIDNVKKYPLIARSKGKEGSVVVEFTLHLDGSISDILILERASFSSFNDAAINAVNSAAPFEPIPAVLGISKMSISVRLTFQLNQ
ncbi:energy transducer TonB [bacterium]|nr:energy transducer TonB [bacterium]